MSGRSRRPSSSCSVFSRCCSASRRACSASASAPSTFVRPRRRLRAPHVIASEAKQSRAEAPPGLLRRFAPRNDDLAALLQIGCGAGEDFDQPRFVIRVAFEALPDGLAQVIERGLDEGRERAAIAALATLAAAPATDALAE